jgi:hypothetical protein
MKTLCVILFCLALWWIVLALLAVRSEMSTEMRGLRREFRKNPPTGPRKHYGTPMPTWDDCMAHPSSFIVLAIFGLAGVILHIVFWPKLLIHWFLYGRFDKRKPAA